MNEMQQSIEGLMMQGRFVAKAEQRYKAFLAAAQSYPAKLTESERTNLLVKPFDEQGGHIYYIRGMYQLLNMLDLARLPRSSIVADIGGGSGWVTEILLHLGYRVLLIEPSRAMIDVALERVDQASQIARKDLRARLDILEGSIEELPAGSTYSGSIDLGLFMESFHHVIDERQACANAISLLKPGGAIGLCGESRWHPGNVEQAAAWEEEMRTFGTLESPFTAEYLKQVLQEAGFAPVQFFHAVNGLFNTTNLERSLSSIDSSLSSTWQNNVLAFKPNTLKFPILKDKQGESCEIQCLHLQSNDHEASVTMSIKNTGKSVWLPNGPALGHVTVACLITGLDGATTESPKRGALPKMIMPGERITLHEVFPLQTKASAIELRLVAEHSFWFDQLASCSIPS